MRNILIVALVFLSACVSEPLPDGFKASDDFDPVVAAKNRISLGLTYLRNGDFSQAKYNLDKALQFAPRLADAHYSMAYYYQQVDEVDLADRAYQKALDFDPRNPDIANSYGAFLCENGKYKQAKKYFLKAVNSSNYISTAETYENLALCSQSQGRIDDAITYLESAINHQPSRGKSLVLLVELQMQQQQWQQARTNLRRYEKIAQVSAETLWRSIEIETALNNTTLAQGYGDMLIRMYPAHPNTLQYIKNKGGVTAIDTPGKISRQLSPTANVVITPVSEQLTADQQASETATQEIESKADETLEPVIISMQIDQQSAQQNSLSKQAEMEDNEVEIAVSEVAESNEVAPLTTEPRYHVIQEGENLYRISLKYNVRMQRLVEWNDLQADKAIVVGERLMIIDPDTVE